MWQFGVVMLRIGAGKQTWEFLLSGSLAGLELRSRTEETCVLSQVEERERTDAPRGKVYVTVS